MALSSAPLMKSRIVPATAPIAPPISAPMGPPELKADHGTASGGFRQAHETAAAKPVSGQDAAAEQ